MERFSDTTIEDVLRELRPTVAVEFASELDAWTAAGCPPRSKARQLLPIGLTERLRVPSPRRLAFAGGTLAVVAIAVATALIGGADSESPLRTRVEHRNGGSLLNTLSGTAPESAPAEGASSAGAQTTLPSSGQAIEGFAATSGRAIERSARVTLLADPEDVADDSAQVFAAVHDAHGIVLRSNTTQGAAGRAGATFDLLVPSARLGDALAAISAIDEVGSRHDTTVDITAPTVSVARQLHASRARIDDLLAQLAAAETETERAALEAELRGERRQAKALEAQLSHLHERTHYSHLSVRIESGRSSTSTTGPWGVGDAFHDAGHLLSVAAGVTLVSLAVFAPIALLLLIAWLTHRSWLRARRERALSGR